MNIYEAKAPAFELPPAYSNAQAQKWNMNKFIEEKKVSPDNSGNLTHSEYEKNLWIANCFIIPLIVYPILTLFGHLVIEILRNKYAGAYEKIDNYLEGKAQLVGNKKGEYQLNDDDVNKIRELFQKNLNPSDCRLRNDPLYQQLVQTKAPVIQRAEQLLSADIAEMQAHRDALRFGSDEIEEKLHDAIKRAIPDQPQQDEVWKLKNDHSKTRTLAFQIVQNRIEEKSRALHELQKVRNSRDIKLQEEVLMKAGFQRFIPELHEGKVQYYY